MWHLKTPSFSVKILSILVVIVGFFVFGADSVSAATRTWDGGGGGDTNWSTAANWSDNTVPVSGDDVVFSNTSDNNSTVDSGFVGTVTSVSVNSGYDGTITLARSLVVSSTFTTSSGTFSAANQTLSIGSTFTMNVGSTFTASSTTTSFAGNFTINGGTFNNNTGTVAISGTGNATLSCNNVTLNRVTFVHTNGFKNVSSNCNLPLGAAPSISNNVTLNGGTLSGTGTLTMAEGTLTINANGNLSGFDGIVTNGAAGAGLSIAGGTFNAGTYTTFDINNSFIMTSGTFTAPSGSMNVAGAFTISGSSVFNHNSGTVVFDGATNIGISCNNITFNAVTFAHTGGFKNVNTNCNLPLGNNPILGSGSASVTLNGGTISGTGTVTSVNTLTINTGSALSGFSGLSSVLFTVAGASVDLNGYSSFIVSSTTTLSSGSLSLPNNADLNGALVISGGTFTAPSGTMTLAGNLTISGTPIFNHNNGTITFDGSTATLSCNSVSFFLVHISGHSAGIKTVNSNCNLPLGGNPTVASPVVLNGKLNGAGTLAVTDACCTLTLTLNSGSELDGFSGLFVPNLVVNGATADFSGYSTFVATRSVCVGGTNTSCNVASSGMLSVPNGADINGNLTVFAGSVTAPSSGTMTLAGGLTISGASTFNANGGTLILDGTGVLSCNNQDFNLVSFTGQTGAYTVNSNCSLPLGNNPTIPNTLTLNGSINGSGTLTFTTGTFRMNSGSQVTGFTGFYGNALTMFGGDWNVGNYTTFNINNYTQNAGTFTAPSGTMIIRSHIQRTAGTFNHNNGTVQLIGQNVQIWSGANTYYNLTVDLQSDPVSNATLLVTSSGTQTVLGTLTLRGAPGNNLSLGSLAGVGVQWNIDPQGARILQYLNVQDSNNINGTVMTAYDSVDSGNNINWAFAISPTPDSLNFQLISPSDTSYINNNRPAFVWSAATSSIGASIDHYVLQMDNGNLDGNWELLDIPAYQQGGYFTSKYQVQYQGFDDDNPNNNYVVLSTNGSTDWGIFENQGQIDEGQQTWSVTAFDTQGNSFQLSRNVLLDQTQPATTVTRIPSAAPVRGQTNSYTTRNRQPLIFGSILDPLNGTWPPDTIASGPSQVNVLIEKRNLFGLYTWQSTQVLPVLETFWTADNGLVNDNFQNTSSKYTRFSFAPQQPLLPGNYKVTFIGQDTAGNYQPSQSVFLKIQ